MRFMNCMIDITRCPLTLILTKTQIILSNIKSYENDKKVCWCISGHKWIKISVIIILTLNSTSDFNQAPSFSCVEDEFEILIIINLYPGSILQNNIFHFHPST